MEEGGCPHNRTGGDDGHVVMATEFCEIRLEVTSASIGFWI